MSKDYVSGNDFTAIAARLNSNHVALLGVTLAIAKHIGLNELDGLPIQNWYEKQRLAELEKFLIEVEDADPALAAALQQQIDIWRKLST